MLATFYRWPIIIAPPFYQTQSRVLRIWKKTKQTTGEMCNGGLLRSGRFPSVIRSLLMTGNLSIFVLNVASEGPTLLTAY